MKPLARKVVIKPDPKEETTASGIIKVDVHTSKHAKGTVISVGSKVTDVAVNDRVIYSPALFDEIEHEGEELHVVEENDIFAII